MTIGAETPNANSKLHQINGSEQTIAADVVITAFGFRPNTPSWLADAHITATDKGLIATGTSANSALAHQTSNPKVFAGGDIVRGSDLVVTAIYDGRCAANDILQIL